MGTFRDKDGLWTQVNIEDVATPEAFARDPAKVMAFYNARRGSCTAASPNAAHFALAELQASSHDVTLMTQNIDDLHEKADRRRIHMHGEIMRALCARCGIAGTQPKKYSGRVCPSCSAASGRPDIVWFGEIPYHMGRIEQALAKQTFCSGGTSGAVYPATFRADGRRNGG